MSKGRITVTKEGKRHIHKGGRLDVTTGDGSRGSCCCCKPFTLASYTASDYATWDLSPYQGDGVSPPNRYWRLINNYTGYVPIRRGCVDDNGKLVGLPDSVSTTTYKYTWYFYLEIGCRDGDDVRFPTGTESESLYNCNFS